MTDENESEAPASQARPQSSSPGICRGNERNMWESPKGRSQDWGRPPSYESA